MSDPSRYELARAEKVEQEARRLRRENLREEGTYVLASEVTRQIERQMTQEIAEFETVLRDGARRVADRLGVDFKETRALLVQVWRDHRAARADTLEAAAAEAEMTADETAADI